MTTSEQWRVELLHLVRCWDADAGHCGGDMEIAFEHVAAALRVLVDRLGPPSGEEADNVARSLTAGTGGGS